MQLPYQVAAVQCIMSSKYRSSAWVNVHIKHLKDVISVTLTVARLLVPDGMVWVFKKLITWDLPHTRVSGVYREWHKKQKTSTERQICEWKCFDESQSQTDQTGSSWQESCNNYSQFTTFYSRGGQKSISEYTTYLEEPCRRLDKDQATSFPPIFSFISSGAHCSLRNSLINKAFLATDLLLPWCFLFYVNSTFAWISRCTGCANQLDGECISRLSYHLVVYHKSVPQLRLIEYQWVDDATCLNAVCVCAAAVYDRALGLTSKLLCHSSSLHLPLRTVLKPPVVSRAAVSHTCLRRRRDRTEKNFIYVFKARSNTQKQICSFDIWTVRPRQDLMAWHFSFALSYQCSEKLSSWTVIDVIHVVNQPRLKFLKFCTRSVWLIKATSKWKPSDAKLASTTHLDL